MNQHGNLAGYLPGCGTGSMSQTRPDTGSLSTSGGGTDTEPPHVRAIASRPVPTRPIQGQTGPGGLDHDPDFFKEKNGQTLSSVSAEVAREARAPRTRERAWGAAA